MTLVFSSSPVVVPEFDMAIGLQDLSIFQPGDLWDWLTLGQAGEDGSGAHRASNGLRGLNKLCWGCKHIQRNRKQEITRTPLLAIQKKRSLNKKVCNS